MNGWRYSLAMLSEKQLLLQRILRCASLVLFLLLVLSWWFRGALPGPDSVDPQLFRSPYQTATTRKIFIHKLNGYEYMVEPQAEYDQTGLVVSTNYTWRDMFAIVGDPIDTPDLGMVWDMNLQSGDLHKVSFWSGEFTLNFQHGPGVKFYLENAGNNHMLASTPEVYNQVTSLRRGDQIRIVGALVNYYRTDIGPYWRKSSLTRTDTGNGACEVIFVDRIEVISRGTPFWYFTYGIAFWGLVLALLGQAALFVRMITKPRPRPVFDDRPVPLSPALQPAGRPQAAVTQDKPAFPKATGNNLREIEPWH